MKRSIRKTAWLVIASLALLSLALAACQPATPVVWDTPTPTSATTYSTVAPAQPGLDSTPAGPAGPTPTPFALEGAKTTATGLQYREDTAGSGATPQKGDLVTMHYIASLTDGTELANTYTQGQPATTVWGENRLLPGWEEGVGLMKTGGKSTFLLPPDLAFGAAGAGNIPPDTSLILQVELLDVKPAPKPTEVTSDKLTQTASGLQYYDITPGTGTEAITNSNVSTNYTIWVKTDSGYRFIDQSEAGTPLKYVLGRGDTGIAGWDEGTKGMKVGGKRLLVIPPELALGTQSNDLIPANSTMVMEIELTDVKLPSMPTEVSESDYITTTTGLKYYDIISGTGDMPQAGQTVIVQYTGWLTDGTQFDSSVDSGQPLNFVLGAGNVIPGWDQAVATMKVGGKRQIVVPPALGYGEQGAGNVIPPNATLIFEIELLEIK